MTLIQLMTIAIKAYPDGIVAEYVLPKSGKFVDNKHGGDGLARFIAAELNETFEPTATKNEQIKEAVRCLDRAIYELNQVIDALENEE
jgi:hypothetical protein